MVSGRPSKVGDLLNEAQQQLEMAEQGLWKKRH